MSNVSVPTEILSLLPDGKVLTEFALLQGRVGLYGGSFDPIHRVHCEIARELLERKIVDHLVFIPAAQNPLKTMRPVSDRDRVAMVLLAIASISGACLSTLEVDRGELSYTVDTLEQITRLKSDQAELFWIIGSDCLSQLPAWHRVEEIFTLAKVITVQRDQVRSLGQWAEYIDQIKLSGEIREQLKNYFFTRVPNTVSSTAVRNCLLKGERAEALPDEVANYIKQKNLYR